MFIKCQALSGAFCSILTATKPLHPHFPGEKLRPGEVRGLATEQGGFHLNSGHYHFIDLETFHDTSLAPVPQADSSVDSTLCQALHSVLTAVKKQTEILSSQCGDREAARYRILNGQTHDYRGLERGA